MYKRQSLDKEINLAGIPITREEAIENAIPEHKEQEDLFNIAVGYTHWGEYIGDTEKTIRQVGHWQKVPTIPGSQKHFLGLHPNPHWLPYTIWFREAFDTLIITFPRECVAEILNFLEWRNKNILQLVKRDHTEAILNRTADKNHLKV